ncbi:LytR cell envelope-related transcriptional attenuator [Halopolyspora algeriensis]|uniref:LytR cell envelope-related transcriptional attenuator n=1 Tax=Halopolyspora algeriensis TaxID=1500506 RepID=A0A368VPT8_9ACTN|nr:LytR C-terminal domain-containing protein [Halopolyspora algeriensis]RCW43560.1 LytR cell envelope-related transcriptional attenuator [Halopolyspora algeriensis]TQM47655.1 LytR cell envelope-related transcriptional attenuator [Halopolyspora algeriensis]
MTSGQPPAGPSAMKLGGFALIGLGVLAAVFGVATVVSGGTNNTAQPPSPPPLPASTATNPAAGSPTTASRVRTSSPEYPAGKPVTPPPGDPGSAAPGTGMPGRTAPGQPTPGQVAPAPEVPGHGGSGKGSVSKATVRIYNNSMIRGLAHRAAEDFRQAGYTVDEVGNYSGGRIPTTTIYYRPGTAEQQQAEAIGARFDARTEPRFDGIADADPGIIVIVTKDYDGAGK